MKVRRITLVWLGLLAATALSWGLGHESLVGGPRIAWGDPGTTMGDPRNAGVLILAIAFLKIRFVVVDFMELRHAPRAMRVAGEAWAICVGGVLIALYRS